ncbi:eCIS core domain-containing protein [Shewanella frigidimarina]|uniref:eCIS core domain-containing protein n=1 Tax=Shewanella frigidimarina TaxID=56812 RepID=UPI003D7ABBCB
MNTHADKTQDNKSQSVANMASHKLDSGESRAQLVDNRPEAIAQKKLQTIANDSPGAKRLNPAQRVSTQAAYSSSHIAFQTPGTSLPFKQQLEHSSGRDLSGIRTHLGQNSALASLGANGAALGNDIAFASSNPPLGLVAHEVAHVLQQRQNGSASHAASELDAQQAARSAEAGMPMKVHASTKRTLHLNYASLSPTGRENIDAKAEQDYANKAEEFEYKLGVRLSTDGVVVGTADTFLGQIRTIVRAWATQTNQQFQTVCAQEFNFQGGDKYYGAFKMTGQNVERVFQSLNPLQTNKPMRSKLKVIYNAVRNNNLAKWLKVASDDLLDRERFNAGLAPRHNQSVLSSNTNVRTQTGLNLAGARHERVAHGFAHSSGLDAALLADPGLRARVEAASAGEKVNVNLGPPGVVATHIGAPDMFSSIARGTPNEAAQVDLANKDREYNANQGADFADQSSLAYGDVADLTDEEKELLYERAEIQTSYNPFSASKFNRLQTATNGKIQWEQGREAIAVMINSDIDKQARQIGARLEAGISGSTGMMLVGAKNVGLSGAAYQKRLRLSMLGWMLPNHDHSFYEIMKAAEIQGVPFIQPANKGGFYEANGNYEPRIANVFKNLLPENEFPSYFLSVTNKNALAGGLAPLDVEPAGFDVATMRLALIAQGFDNALINGLNSRSIIDLKHLDALVISTNYKDEAAGNPVNQAKAMAANRVAHMHVRDAVPYRNIADNYPTHAERWYGLLLANHNISQTVDQELLVATTEASLGNETADLTTRTTGLEENIIGHIDGVPADLLLGLNQNVIDDLVQLEAIIFGLAFNPVSSLHIAPNKVKYEKLLKTSIWTRIKQNIPDGGKGMLILARLVRKHYGDLLYKSIYSKEIETPEATQALQSGVPLKVVRALVDPVAVMDLARLITDITTISTQAAIGQVAALNLLGTTAPLSNLKIFIDANIGPHLFDVVVSSVAARRGINVSADPVRNVQAQLGASLSPDVDINSPAPVNPNFVGSEVNDSYWAERLNRLFDWWGSPGIDALTVQEKAAIYVYTGVAGEGAWQSFLNSPSVSMMLLPDGRTARQALIEEVPQIQTAISGLRKLPHYTNPTYNAQYKGAPMNVPLFMNTFRVGSVHHKDNFFSSSRNNTNIFFTGLSYKINWTINKLKTGVDVRILSKYHTEDEVLFPPGASFVVTKVEDRSNLAAFPGGFGKIWVWVDEL